MKQWRYALEQAVTDVAHQVQRAQCRVDWRQWDERSLWYELAACILGSRVRFEIANAAVSRLRGSGLLDELLRHDSTQALEQAVARTLAGPTGARYAYPRLRAQHICTTAASLYRERGSLIHLLTNSRSDRDARMRLIATCVGIGPKQASLFLRNVGYSSHLAILDAHVLRFMAWIGLSDRPNGTVASLSAYERLEAELARYAVRLDVALGELDVAIWVVMRTFQREFAK